MTGRCEMLQEKRRMMRNAWGGRELSNNGNKVRYFSSFTENAGNRGKKWRNFFEEESNQDSSWRLDRK
ncbi:hypothetical protein ABEO75_30515 [Paenibacillus macerans]|uniref:hypothetical protein n=1 Tax=Paenibacillus macerans TaxID=44252 RepID=UPI002E1CE01F|nr:hypothetical protein [Paenibacillus macerans]